MTLQWNNKLNVIYQAWDAVFYHQMKHREPLWSIFDKLWGHPEETLSKKLDITSQTKWFSREKLRMQKWTVFHLISKQWFNINFLCIFFMNYYWGWECCIINFLLKYNSECHWLIATTFISAQQTYTLPAELTRQSSPHSRRRKG